VSAYESGDEQESGDSNNDESLSESEESNQSDLSDRDEDTNKDENGLDEKRLDSNLSKKSPVESGLEQTNISNEIVDVDEESKKETLNQLESTSELNVNTDAKSPKSPGDASPIVNPNYSRFLFKLT
jgi:hypothetical protein